jgi:serine phosphatase RsbU (regulator of sigma subunit)/ligand-binding sensor domain-containing protein
LHVKNNSPLNIATSRHISLIILSFLFCFLTINNSAIGQQYQAETGLPHILNYSAKQHKAHDQNWCIVQDSLGLIYIGNNIGLLIFDGIEFDFIPFESIIYSLGKDEQGNIYYGGDGDFGILKQNETGKLVLHSLLSLVPQGFNSFAEVWSVKCFNDQILFSTKEHIYSYKNNKITIIKPSKGSGIHKCFDLKSNYLVREFEGGFSYLVNNKLNFIKGSEVFAETMVDFVQEIGNTIFIGTRKNGFYEMEWNPKVNPLECKIKPINFPISSHFQEGELYHGILLSNGNLCFATKNDGIFISDQQGNMLEHYTKEKGFLDNRVWYVFEDKNKNLWAASNKGISMIDYLTPIRQYNSIQGLSGSINNVNVIDDKLYINSDLGLFEGVESKEGLFFNAHPYFKNPSFNISKFSKNGENDLIVATKTGLTAIRKNNIIPIEEGIEFYTSLQCAKNPEILVAAGKNIITIYKFENKQYNLLTEFEYPSQFRCIIENEKGEVFISGNNKALVKVNPSNGASSFFELIPLKIPIEIKSENFIFQLKNKMFIGSANGIYEIIQEGKQINFVKSDFFPPDFQNDHNYIFRAYVDHHENFWLAYDYSVRIGVIAQFKKNEKKEYSFNNLWFNKFQGIQKNGFCEDQKGNLWIATNEGLLKYNTNEVIHYKNDFPVFIKKITLKNDSSFSLIRGVIPEILKNKLPFQLNGISFQFSVANFTGVEDLMFSSRLLPIESNFSEWTIVRTKDYNYLPEGSYTLEVKSKDIFNNISKVKKYTFEIAPPWYRSNLAYIVYFILGIALVYLLIKYNTKRLRAINDLLEKTVKERTHELWEERDKLHEANLEITDSINYAKIIQQSILPDVKDFKQAFKDSFIYFKPRNIVSGDFYWFNLLGNNKKLAANLNQHIIVAADCTGHGVPGAFMSMIGSEKLNQSIAEISDLTPANILSFMNQKIKDSLKQEDGNSQSKDGMEISLCFLDLDTNILTFAGANRPLWIYRKGCKLEDVEIIKPTKAGIAGHTRADQVFEETEIQLFPGDTIYMFTDGAPDQFGGPKNKKLTTKGFRQLLFDIQSQNMEQQGKAIHGYYRSWMGNNNEQVDDILIMGIRI